MIYYDSNSSILKFSKPPRAEASARAALSAAMLQQGIVTARQDAVLIAWRLLLPSLIRIFG